MEFIRDGNSESLVQCHCLEQIKEQDGMLSSKFRSPAICAATNGDALVTSCHKSKTIIRRPTDGDFFDAPLFAHDTVAVLLLNSPTYL